MRPPRSLPGQYHQRGALHGKRVFYVQTTLNAYSLPSSILSSLLVIDPQYEEAAHSHIEMAASRARRNCQCDTPRRAPAPVSFEPWPSASRWRHERGRTGITPSRRGLVSAPAFTCVTSTHSSTLFLAQLRDHLNGTNIGALSATQCRLLWHLRALKATVPSARAPEE